MVQSAAVSLKGSIRPGIHSCNTDDITPPTGMVSFTSTNTALTPAESTRSKRVAQLPRVQEGEDVQFASDQAGAGGLGPPQPHVQQEDTSLLSSSNSAKSGPPSMSSRSKTAKSVQLSAAQQVMDSAAAANATVSGSGVGKLSEYELLRLRKIQRNKAKLAKLGLSEPIGEQLKDNSTSNNSKKKRKKDSTSNNSRKKRKKGSTSVPAEQLRRSNRSRTEPWTFTQEDSCAFIRKEAAKGNRVKVQPDDGILSREQIQTMDGVVDGGNDTVEGEINETSAGTKSNDEEPYEPNDEVYGEEISSIKKSDNKDTSSTKLSLKEQAKARSEEVDAMLKTEFNENWEAFAKHYEKEETAIEDTMPDGYKVKVKGKFTYEYSPAEVAKLDEKEDIDKLSWNQCRGLLNVVGLSVKGQTLDELRERIKEFKRTGGGKFLSAKFLCLIL